MQHAMPSVSIHIEIEICIVMLWRCVGSGHHQPGESGVGEWEA